MYIKYQRLIFFFNINITSYICTNDDDDYDDNDDKYLAMNEKIDNALLRF